MTNPEQNGVDFSEVIDDLRPTIAQVRSGRRVASGVLFEDGAHVLTIARLMGRKDRGVITLGGEELEVTKVIVDRRRDLAVLKLDEPREAGPAWVDAGDVKVGQAVVVLGRPSEEVEATWGIVRKTAGAWTTPRGGGVHAFLDVDGALPPGFSGGPLVDREGNVLGVNTRGLIPGGTTLPTETVRSLIARAASGKTGRGYLGVRVQRGRLGVLEERAGQSHGLVVLGVGPDTPAAEAEFYVGDVLLSVEGEPLSSYPELLVRLGDRADLKVTLQTLRGGEPRDVEVTLASRGG
jgi:S1-C subfamily serine protease